MSVAFNSLMLFAIIAFLSLGFYPKETLGVSQPVLQETTEQQSTEPQSTEPFTEFPRIKELLERGEDHSISADLQLKAVHEANREAKSTNDRRLELRTLIRSMKVIFLLSDVNQLKHLLDRATELDKKVGDPRLTAQIQVFQAKYSNRTYRFSEAIEWIKKAHDSEQLLKRDLAHSYNTIGFAFRRMGMVRKAFDAFHQAIAMYNDDPQAEEVKIAKNNLAWMFIRTNNFDRAESFYDGMTLKPEDTTYFAVLIGQCEIALHRDDFDRAIELTRLGLERIQSARPLKKNRSARLTGVLHLIRSRCYFAQGDIATAQAHCEKATKLIAKKSYRYTEAYTQLGLIVAERESLERGIEIIRKAFNDAKALSGILANDGMHAKLFSSESLTKLYSKNGDFKEACAQVKETEKIRDSLKFDDLECHVKLGEMRRQAELDEQQLELVKTEERAKTAQAELAAANAVSNAEKSKTIRNVIGTIFILTLLGGAGYCFSENRRLHVQQQLNETRERAEFQEQFAQKKRIEDIGQLTGSVAHDFNNILQVIGHTDYLMDGSLCASQTDKQKELLDKKTIAVNAAAKITEQLLTYARRQAITPKVALVSTMLESTEALFDSIGDLIKVNILNLDETLAINVDQAQFSSSILNLLLNARDAMAGQGLIDIKISEQAFSDSNNLSLETGEYVSVEVADSGKGMNEEQLERACEPFFTTKPPKTGAGLSLSSVKGFVEQAGGAINIQSKLWGGTTVSLYFPKAQLVEAQSQTRAAERTHAIKNTRLCLIVEDDESVRSTLALMLESFGFDCTSCSSADEAHILLKSSHDFSLVISDVLVPGEWDGLELAQWIRTRFPGLQLVLTSGKEPPQNLEDFIFLRKPIRISDLQSKLKLEFV